MIRSKHVKVRACSPMFRRFGKPWKTLGASANPNFCLIEVQVLVDGILILGQLGVVLEIFLFSRGLPWPPVNAQHLHIQGGKNHVPGAPFSSGSITISQNCREKMQPEVIGKYPLNLGGGQSTVIICIHIYNLPLSTMHHITHHNP